MLRVIVRTDNAAMAANVGGNVHTTHKTFDLNDPILEAYLREVDSWQYTHRMVVGVEVVEEKRDG